MLTVAKYVVLVITWAAMAPAANAQQTEPSLFVGAQLREGFLDVDAGVRDSIRDIQQEMNSDPTRRFRLAERAETATLVLIVLARGIVTSGSIGSSSTIAGTGIGFVAPNSVPTLTTALRVGSYEKRLQSEGGTWRTAAKSVVGDVAAWWDANRAAVHKKQ